MYNYYKQYYYIVLQYIPVLLYSLTVHVPVLLYSLTVHVPVLLYIVLQYVPQYQTSQRSGLQGTSTCPMWTDGSG